MKNNFVYVESIETVRGVDYKIGLWVNLANVTTISDYRLSQQRIVVKFVDRSSITLTGESKDAVLKAIEGDE